VHVALRSKMGRSKLRRPQALCSSLPQGSDGTSFRRESSGGSNFFENHSRIVDGTHSANEELRAREFARAHEAERDPAQHARVAAALSGARSMVRRGLMFAAVILLAAVFVFIFVPWDKVGDGPKRAKQADFYFEGVIPCRLVGNNKNVVIGDGGKYQRPPWENTDLHGAGRKIPVDFLEKWDTVKDAAEDYVAAGRASNLILRTAR
jgi:hypothetical protein